MDRRRFLAASATVATVGFAGCGSPGGDGGGDGNGSGNGSGGGEDPYEIDDPERVDRPAEPA